jgi:translation initiation factor 2B subunit (eIF-2B alpha/beta/delta family)
MSVGKVLSRDLTQQLNNAIQFLVHCRPLSISMGNAIKYVKLQASYLLSFAYQRHPVTRP